MHVTAATLDKLKSRFGERGWTMVDNKSTGNVRFTVSAGQVYVFLSFLKGDCGFDFLSDVTCVDFLYYRGAKDRFGLTYVVANYSTNEQLVVRTYLNEPDLSVKSVVSLWQGANWMEREVYDMFGIVFEGHPDLRRILMPEEFAAFPLRKDYPLRGRGERHNFQRITRVEG